MRCMLIKTENGLRGATSEDHEVWLKFKRRLNVIKTGSFLRLEYSSPRNGKHHRLLFALINLVTENSEIYDTKAKALVGIKLATGYFDLVADPTTGEIIKIPDSIAFENMPQEDFDVFYSRAIDGILHHILPHIERSQAERLIDMIISGWA